MILRRKRSPPVEVQMSPLIDCVFLLLIFFLVTSMLKKTEKQIPIRMPDSQLQVADKADSHGLTLGIDRGGNLSIGRRGTTDQMIDFQPLADLPAFLRDLQAERGADVPIQFAVEAGTQAQVVIDVLDRFQLAGFDRVYVRLQSDDYIITDAVGGS